MQVKNEMEAIKSLNKKIAGIIESGSNDNGNYIKFTDGTMIQYVYTKVTDQAIDTPYGSLFVGTRIWTFPIPFIEMPIVSCSKFQWGSGASWGNIRGADKTSATLRGTDAFSRASGTNTIISAIAIRKMEIKRRLKI